jgi:protein gp37
LSVAEYYRDSSGFWRTRRPRLRGLVLSGSSQSLQQQVRTSPKMRSEFPRRATPISGRLQGFLLLVFTCSHSDWFHPKADEWRDEAWGIIKQCPNIIFQILTKRPERISDHLPADWGSGYPNVWLGVSVELQQYTTRMDILREIPCALRFVSGEPQLGPITWNLNGYGWLIDGGESDMHSARPAKPEWFLSNRDQCLAAQVPYFHKQNGSTKQCECHGVWGCSLLDGKIYDAMPQSIHLDEKMRTTHIGWTLRSWNPFYGCDRVSPGCKHCYCLDRAMKRLGVPEGEVRRSKTRFYDPLRWQRKLERNSLVLPKVSST